MREGRRQLIAMAAGSATGANAEKPAMVDSAGSFEFEVMMLINIFMVAALAFMVGRLWSRKTEQDLAEKVKHLNDKIKHVEEVAKLAREDADHWEEAVSRAQEDIDQIRSRRFFMARRGVRLHTRQDCHTCGTARKSCIRVNGAQGTHSSVCSPPM